VLTKPHILKNTQSFLVLVYYILVCKTLKCDLRSLPQCICRFMMVRVIVHENVHLSDKVLGTHHILPIIFLFTSPAKFCFRAVANFDRFVTDMKMSTPTTSSSSASSGRRPSFLPSKSLFARNRSGQSDDAPRMASGNNIPMLPISPNYQSSSGPALSAKTTQALLPTLSPQEYRETRFRAHCRQAPNDPSDACGLRFRANPQMERAERTAGEPQVYEDIKVRLKK